MSQIVLLSKEEKTFFSFEERRLFVQGVPCNKTLKGIPLEVLKYLSEKSPEYIPYQDVFEEVWANRLDKALYPKDNSRMREVLGDIRNYLHEEQAPYKYIQSDYGKCRSTIKIIVTEDELNVLHMNLDNLIFKMADIAINLEALRDRLEIAKSKNDTEFIKLYAQCFENFKFSFENLQKEIEKSKQEIEFMYEIHNTIEVNKSKGTGKVTIPKVSTEEVMRTLDHTINKNTLHIEEIEEELNEAIYAWLSNEVDDLDWLWNLPKNEEIAATLFNLTKSFDIFELYSALFTDYREFLNNDKMHQLVKRAKTIFDQELLKYWEIDEL